MAGSRVYLIAQPTVSRFGKQPDLRPLAEFGPIRVLVQAGEYPTFQPQRCLELIENRLAEFDEKKDYIAWAGGDTLAAVLTGSVLTRKGCTHLRWLRYERGRDSDGNRVDEGARYVAIPVALQPKHEDEAQQDLFPHEGVKSAD